MRIEHLEYFAKVVECGSITIAASQLFISPQGLSQALKQLEKELDISLFIRNTSNFTLSPAGQLLYDNALKILSIDTDLHIDFNRLRSLNKNPSERLSIYVSHSISYSLLSSVIIAFHKKYPYLGTRITELNSLEIFDNCKNREPSITFFSLPEYLSDYVRNQYPWINIHIAHVTQLLALFSRRSPLTRKSEITSDELIRHPMVLYATDNMFLKDLFDIDVESANILLTSSNIETCRTLLANDDNAIGFTNALVEPFFDQSKPLATKPIVPVYDFVFGYFMTHEENLPEESNEFLQIFLKLINH